VNRTACVLLVCAAMAASCRGANGKLARAEESAPKAVARAQPIADPFAFDPEL
jgi:hypothetical protein